ESDFIGRRFVDRRMLCAAPICARTRISACGTSTALRSPRDHFRSQKENRVMSIKKNKLSLRTETLRTLSSPELEAAAGGNQFPTTTTTSRTTTITDTVKSVIGGCPTF